jgi:hypothetical protein
MDLATMAVSLGLGGVSGATIVGKVVPWISRAFQKRQDRKAKTEEKRISAESHVKVAEIAADAKRDVAESTGAHKVLSEANEFIRELRKERVEDRQRLLLCEERHETTERELKEVRDQCTSMQTSLQSAMAESEECKREREIDRKRLNSLAQEMVDLRKSMGGSS